MNDLLTRTWTLLRGNWILLSILVIETMVMLMFKGGEVAMSPNFTLELALYFFHLAVLAGWLFQMKRVALDASHRTTWDDFFNGVARYFGPLLGGGAMFLLVCLLGIVLAMGLAGAIAGQPDLKLVTQLWQLVQAEKVQELQKLFEAQSPGLQQLESWVLTCLGGLSLLGIYTATLCFWTQWCVLADSNWLKAWSNSQRVMFKHWKPMLWVGMVWLLPTVVCNLGLFSGFAPIVMVAFFLSLLAKTYFTLLFCLLLIELEPEKITPLPPATSLRGQA